MFRTLKLLLVEASPWPDDVMTVTCMQMQRHQLSQESHAGGERYEDKYHVISESGESITITGIIRSRYGRGPMSLVVAVVVEN
jgi:hypothetical protein